MNRICIKLDCGHDCRVDYKEGLLIYDCPNCGRYTV